MEPLHSRRRFLASVGAAGSLAVAGCFGSDTGSSDPEPVDSQYDLSVTHDIESWDRYDPEWEPPQTSPTEATFGTETVIENLEVGWDLEFADSGEVFISERVGRISRYSAGELEAVATPDDVIDHADSIENPEDNDWWAGGSEGGLLGIALHPNYPEVPVLYAFYTYQAGEEDYRNRLVFYDLENDNEETVVIDDIPGHRIIHNGARLAFGPRNYLWVTTGDADIEGVPQNLGRLGGKVLRLNPDGTAPEDNPGLEDPRVYTYGHRNPQAVTWLPDGTAVVSEHGPQARDEVQILEAGGNYGWSDVRSGPDDDSYESYPDHPDVVPPLVHTGGTAWAPSGGVFYTGDAVPALQNRFISGGLISQRLNVVSIYDGDPPDIGGQRFDDDWLYPEYDAVSHSLFEDELGRIRHAEQGPDGALYVVTSNRDGRATEQFPKESDDRLLRIVQE
ncbi:MAG: PQQ-dependent sugar dehydrogenase [Natronomonas sp.]